ncbi:MAG: hypothetical protein Q8S21_03170 [Candidatus Paracaedibacteraceae bacterium]|nr:hypothetical protein [Candidatus Paracaedibacteraceae bacterium]
MYLLKIIILCVFGTMAVLAMEKEVATDETSVGSVSASMPTPATCFQSLTEEDMDRLDQQNTSELSLSGVFYLLLNEYYEEYPLSILFSFVFDYFPLLNEKS